LPPNPPLKGKDKEEKTWAEGAKGLVETTTARGKKGIGENTIAGGQRNWII